MAGYESSRLQNSIEKAIDNVMQKLTEVGIGVPDEVQDALDQQLDSDKHATNLVHYAGAVLQRKEIRLRRVLAYGDEIPLYIAGNRINLLANHFHFTAILQECMQDTSSSVELKSLKHSLEAKKKLTTVHLKKELDQWNKMVKDHYPLLKILEEYLDPVNGWPMRKCAIYALAVCTQCHCHQYLKNGLYSLAEKYLKSEDDLFYFIMVASSRLEHDKSPEPPRKKRCRRGWGRGMRNLIQNWYKEQDAVDLLAQVRQKKSLYGWKHKDVIRMAHPPGESKLHKTSDKNGSKADLKAEPKTDLEYAIIFILYDLLNADSSEKHSPAVQRLLSDEMLSKQLDTSDPTSLISRVESLKLTEVTANDSDTQAGEALIALETMKIEDVLQQIAKWKIIGNDKLWEQVGKKLERNRINVKEIKKIELSTIAIARARYVMNLQLESCDKPCEKKRKSRLALKTKLQEVDSPKDDHIVKSLGTLMTLKLKTLKKIRRRVVVAVHLGNTWNSRCAYTKSMSVGHAAALILASLSCQSDLLDIFNYESASSVKSTGVGDVLNVFTLLANLKQAMNKDNNFKAKMEELKSRWIDTFNGDKQVDAFVIITSSLAAWSQKDCPTPDSLLGYHKLQEQFGKERRAKLAVCALASNTINVAEPPQSEHMMYFAGFDAYTIFTLNKFISGAFDCKNLLTEDSEIELWQPTEFTHQP